MRVAVVASSSGSGKTTVGRRLAADLAVPFFELDSLFHGPGWTSMPDFADRVAEAVAQPGWVIDGNYFARGADLTVERADLVVWLDLPLRVCLWRLALRTGRRRLRREELWNGNRENLASALFARGGLFRYAITTHRRRRRDLPERLAGRNHVRLRSRRAVDAFLAGFPALVSEARAGRRPAG